MVSLAGHHVGLDSLEVPDGQVVGGVRVTLVGGQAKVLHRLDLREGNLDKIFVQQVQLWSKLMCLI